MRPFLRLGLCLLALAPSCALFQHPGPVVSCLEKLGEAVVKQAIDKIYSVIDTGTAGNWTEARIIAALAAAGIDMAPEIWQCAMLFVANPPPNPPVGVGPKTATKAIAAAIAADYLAAHPARAK